MEKPLPKCPVYELLRCEVGSTLHGIGVGQDDTDLMSVGLEPCRAVMGLDSFEHWGWRSAKRDERSGPDDVDWIVYGLRKYLRLAMKGNPTMLLPLFAPQSALHIVTEAGWELRSMRNEIVSEQAIDRTLGYMNGQRKRAMEGRSIGHGSQETRAPKWAAHMIRLGFQGLELAMFGKITLPMSEHQAKICQEVKTGELSVDWALGFSESLERAVERERKNTPLRPEPDRDAIDRWLYSVYLRAHVLGRSPTGLGPEAGKAVLV